jgi:hypothetical protein
MGHSDPRPAGGVDQLDELIRTFVARGYPAGGVAGGDDAGAEQHEGHGDGHGDGHGAPSVRTFEYRGHQVRIVTRYEVTIDGEPWDQPMHVRQDGNVAYHGLPQYLVPSAVELIRAVIDYGLEAPDEVRAAVRAARAEA